MSEGRGMLRMVLGTVLSPRFLFALRHPCSIHTPSSECQRVAISFFPLVSNKQLLRDKRTAEGRHFPSENFTYLITYNWGCQWENQLYMGHFPQLCQFTAGQICFSCTSKQTCFKIGHPRIMFGKIVTCLRGRLGYSWTTIDVLTRLTIPIDLIYRYYQPI